MTLSQLRTLLSLAHGPAVGRLPDRGIEAVARAYLPRTIWRSWCNDAADDYPTVQDLANAGPDRMGAEWANNRTLDLTDPGTVNAIKTALALALGLDSGPMGLSAQWIRCLGADNAQGAWQIGGEFVETTAYFYVNFGHVAGLDRVRDMGRYIGAPEVATEPDPIRALVKACEFVIKERK